MATEMREVPFFYDKRIKATVRLEVEIDEDGNYWLTPSQIAYLADLKRRAESFEWHPLVSSASSVI